ncbi:MAG: ATP-binding protein, partial [Dehalococcoidia bacterium]
QLAQALNCQGEERPCGECGQCRRIAEGLHADVQTLTVQAGEGAQHKQIRIAQIREVERAVALRPYEGRSRVVIIDPADALNVEAQNAFLKTLEEPPPDVVFVLVTTREAALLPTIRSRCQRVEFRPVPQGRVEEALSARGLDEERARLLARLARGRIGWALNIAEDESLLSARAEALAAARELPSLSVAQRFQLADRLAGRFLRDRQPVYETLELWREWWRDLLLAQAAAWEGVTNLDLEEALAAEAPRYRQEQVATFLHAIGEAGGYLEDNVNPRLALEALMLEAPTPGPPQAKR